MPKTTKIEVAYDMDSLRRTQIVSCKPDRLFYIPVACGDETLAALNAGICAFACAVNQLAKRSYLVQIKHAFTIPKVFVECINDFNSLSMYANIIFEGPQEKNSKCTFNSPFRVAHLLSGGKDSAYQLQKIIKKYGKRNVTGVYAGGTTINAEYLEERSAAEHIAESLGINLSYVHLEHADYTEEALCVRRRTIWRNMLLFSVARMFGRDISSGITTDPYSHKLEKDILSGTNKRDSYPGISLYFSSTNSVIEAMSRVLSCKILTTDPEIVILHRMEKQWPKLFAQCRSCYNPIRPCDTEHNWEGSCSKCKTLEVLRNIIYQNEITSLHSEFAQSSLWKSDVTLLSIIKSRVRLQRHEEKVSIPYKEVLKCYE